MEPGKRIAGRLVAVAAVAALALSLAPSVAQAAAPRGRYIVVFKDGVERPGAVARDHRDRYGADLRSVYRHALGGYAAVLSSRQASAVSRDPRVAFVEEDQRVEVFAQEVPTGIQRSFAAANPTIDIDGSDDVRVDVDVAVIDTGIDYDHPDLNVVARVDCTGGNPFRARCKDGSGDDGNGHGTHVAGTIGAIDDGTGVVGMAPGARLWAVKVLGNDGSGWMSWIVAGVDWVTARHDQIEVANMSLGCECSSSALDSAIANSVSSGVVHAVAAGNSDEDAKTHSPANHPDVITVSAMADFDGQPGGLGSPTCRTDQDDTLADFSNWGSVVEIAAPGVCILSTWMGGGYATISGTSMASPHAAGAAALLASGAGDPTTKSDVLAIRQTLVDTGNLDWTDDSGDGVKEPLLDVSDDAVYAPATVPGSGGGGGGGDTNTSPSASFSHTCVDLACDFDGSGSSDPDGSVVGYAWDFGDGSAATGATVSHSYASAGSYTVILTVTDDEGATDSESKTVTVGEDAWNLQVKARTSGGEVQVRLGWNTGATSASSVDVYRDGVKVATTENDGAHVDAPGGSGTFTYQLCEAGTTANCSKEVTVTA